ncbi:MAG: CBS domain-containing protein [Candidatus Caldatribacterium sp.]|uniref:CBS domain-containing protein n=1 Tax=Candidatus Caldatribacterium sp. TaxID=2282143 RepID=UPI002998938D|nr:CBS domain-containing protein [Candidatus Caldatribacterium sp.]MCX7730280.1 CBS domain-containing protein [Candidatus Caldatribacterium sp.]MDW8080912.1 CBS domain-containing protein [Candidatus Calescibacterium sp.]
MAVLVEEIMLSEVPTVSDFDTVGDVLNFMIRRKVSGVPVVDLEQRLLGYFSAQIFFQQLLEEAQKDLPLFGNLLSAIREKIRDFAKREVSEFMTEDVEYLAAEDDIEDALDLLQTANIDLIPVVKEGRVVGVVNRVRVLQAFLESK